MEYFHEIELSEKDGNGKIAIDSLELKGLTEYKIKRDADMVTLTITITAPKNKFKTIS